MPKRAFLTVGKHAHRVKRRHSAMAPIRQSWNCSVNAVLLLTSWYRSSMTYACRTAAHCCGLFPTWWWWCWLVGDGIWHLLNKKPNPKDRGSTQDTPRGIWASPLRMWPKWWGGVDSRTSIASGAAGRGVTGIWRGITAYSLSYSRKRVVGSRELKELLAPCTTARQERLPATLVLSSG